MVFGVPGEKKLPPEAPKPAAPTEAATTAEGVNVDEPWRANPPAPGPMPTLALPTATEFKLPNGLTVLFAQRTGVPVVAALLVVRTGSDANPASTPGLANFTAAMLDEGTASRTAPQIADAVAQLGATLTTGSTMDSSSLTTRALAKNFPAALDLLADVALHPSFPAAEIDRQRASRLASLVQQREDPELVAQRTLVSALFGSSHPYGFIEIGTADSNKAITRDQLQAFWKQNFVPNNAALIVVGDTTEADLRALAAKEFGAWQPGRLWRRRWGRPRPIRPGSSSSTRRARRRRSCGLAPWARTAGRPITPPSR